MAADRTSWEKYVGKLEGQIALITGFKSDTSLATAKQLVNEGAYVFIMHHRDPGLAAAIQEIGRNVACVQGDVSDLGDLDRLFAQIQREKGKLDIVFANAAVDDFVPFGEITEERYYSIVRLPGTRVFFAVQKALPLLPNGATIILNVAIIGGQAFAVNSAYSATKAAVLSFARTWAAQLEDRWIRVNAVSSGTAATRAVNDLMASVRAPERPSNSLSNSAPRNRLSTPNEVAKAVVFLASDDSSDVTGAELTVEGDVTRLKMLSNDLPLGRMTSASPDQVAKAVVFLASDDSRGITGMEVFVDGGMARL
jgi:NAD(P)-dependent dehydrogenase (short-subunit alcohol dehydrogenase family)